MPITLALLVATLLTLGWLGWTWRCEGRLAAWQMAAAGIVAGTLSVSYYAEKRALAWWPELVLQATVYLLASAGLYLLFSLAASKVTADGRTRHRLIWPVRALLAVLGLLCCGGFAFLLFEGELAWGLLGMGVLLLLILLYYQLFHVLVDDTGLAFHTWFGERRLQWDEILEAREGRRWHHGEYEVLDRRGRIYRFPMHLEGAEQLWRRCHRHAERKDPFEALMMGPEEQIEKMGKALGRDGS